MTTNNQAFVKTFSRRGRTAGNASSIQSNSPASSAGAAPQVANGVDVGSAPLITRIDPPQANVQQQQGTSPVPVTPVVADIAQTVAKQQRVISLQHNHTAYASAATGTERSGQDRPSAPFQPMAPAPPSGPAPPVTQRFDLEPHVTPRPHHDGKTKQPSESKRAIEPFQAVWEVNVFDVPARVADLFFDGKRYQQIAERMAEAVQDGLQTVLVTSSQSGEGRSSVAIGIAMASAASGIRVALVDVDTETPTLAEDLRLDLQYGWVDTVRGGLPIKEIAVHAVEDGVTLIPLMPPHGQTAATAYEVTRLVDTLKGHFDLLIMDGPSAGSSDAMKIAAVFDSAVLVRDVTRTDDKMVDEVASQLQAAGIHGVGVVDNFA